MKKRFISLLAAITMLCTFVPVIAQADMNINIGEYIQMGSYYGKPILWRCVDIDENGPLMLSDKILCLKSFDAAGSETSGSHGRASVRESYGSNYWADSNIRSWLNSSAAAGEVDWLCGNPPSADNIRYGYNAYADEAGFLSNFTANERKAMKSVSQKTLVASAEYDKGMYDTGIKRHDYNIAITSVIQNYDTAFAEYVTDKMFLLDVKQVNAVYNNGDVLGEDYYIGVPTAECVENTEYKNYAFKEGDRYDYWLRTAFTNYNENVRYVYSGGGVIFGYAYTDAIGVRPAFYLDLSSSVKSGSGTSEDPYTIEKKAVTPASETSVDISSSGDEKLINEAGLDPEKLLENITFGADSIKGPKLSVLGHDFYLFDINGKLKLSIGDVEIQLKVDAKKQTIQLIGGYDVLSENVSTGTDYTGQGEWTKSYNQLKSFYKALSGESLDDKTAKKQFGAVYNKMKAMKSNLFLNLKGNFAIYGELAFDNGSWKLSEGGAILSVGASGSIDPRIGGVFYGTMGLALSASGHVTLKFDGVDEPLAISSKMNLEPAINLGLGAGSKTANLYIEGGIKGKLPIDILAATGSFVDDSSNLEPLIVKLQGYLYISGKAFVFGYDKEWQLGNDVVLYPRNGEVSLSSIDSTSGDAYTIDMSELKLIPRDYGEHLSLMNVSDEFDKYDLYPYSTPKLAELSDGRKVLIWIDDDASKADADRTSLYYSVFNPADGTWSVPKIAVSNIGYNDMPQICSSGDKIHIVWSSANKAFGDNADINEMASAMELYYTSFDGSTFSDTKLVSEGDNSLCEMLYAVSENEGKVTIVWVENNENDLALSNGVNCIFRRTFDGEEWGEKRIVAAVTDELHDVRLTESGNAVYECGEDGVSKIYSENNLIGKSSNYNASLQTVGNTVYYLSGNELIMYDIDTGEEKTEEIGEITDITIFENGNEKTALSLVSTGFTSELYQNEYSDGKWGEWTKLTSYDRYIRDYSAMIDDNGAVSAALNLVEVEDPDKGGYGTAELKVISDIEYFDLILNSAYYDDSVTENSSLDVCFDVTNNSREDISSIFARITDENGEELFSGNISCLIAPGETKTLTVPVTIPQGFRKQELTADISCDYDENDMTNNSVSFIAGFAELSLDNISIYKDSAGVHIKGAVSNSGFETAENVTIDVRNSDSAGDLLNTITIGNVPKGESVDFSYMLPERYLNYSGEKQSVYIEAKTNSQEMDIGNNSDRILLADLSEIENITDFTASYDNGMLTINTPMSRGVEFYAVYYDINGNLASCIKNTLSVGAGTNNIQLTGFKTGWNVKFFFWDESMNQLCEALTFE